MAALVSRLLASKGHAGRSYLRRYVTSGQVTRSSSDYSTEFFALRNLSSRTIVPGFTPFLTEMSNR
jgi:hypothetical protein